MPDTYRRFSFGKIFGFAIACLISGCRPSTPEPGLSREKLLEVIRVHIHEQPILFERVEYNPPLDQLAERWIDPAIERGVEQRYFGRWPETESEAKRLAMALKDNVWRDVLDSPEGRSLVEKQMQSYWGSPKVEVSPQGDSVDMDLGVTPGPIERTSRGYYSITRSEFEKDSALIPAELVRRLKSLKESHPNASRWRVKVILRPYIERQHPVIYEYSQTADRLFVYTHQEVYYSPDRLEGDLERLLMGVVPIQPSGMKLLPKDRAGKPFVLP